MHVSMRRVVDDMHAIIAYGTLFNFTSIRILCMALIMVIYVLFAMNIPAYIQVNVISFALVTTFFLPASTVALEQRNTISVCDILLRSHMVCPFTTRLISYFLQSACHSYYNDII